MVGESGGGVDGEGRIREEGGCGEVKDWGGG